MDKKTSYPDGIVPPMAEKAPKLLEIHGDKRIDNYYWLNERENPEVIDYLERENAYLDLMMAHTKGLQQALFEEMKGRIKEEDASVPYFHNGYWYLKRYEEGKQYPIYARKKATLEAPEEIILDCNLMAEDQSYFHLRGVNVSPDNKWVSYGIDTLSRRLYTIHIKNLETGEVLADRIVNTTGEACWGNDNKTIFYTTKDTETLREDKIYRHILATPVSEDALIYDEKDETFSVLVYTTKSQKYITIKSYSTLTTEHQILDADKPLDSFKVFQPRTRELEYDIDHYGKDFYILTNADGAHNFKIMKTPVGKTTKENWVDVIPHRKEVLIEDMELFKEYLVVNEKENGLNKLRVIRWTGNEDYFIPMDGETYSVLASNNPEFETDILRYEFTSLTTPPSTIDFNMKTKEQEVKKEQPVLGNFDKNNYRSERIWATASDGTKIPMSLVYHKNTKKSTSTPVLQYAYGSYGYTIDPYFSSNRLSLLDRGFIYAIAHVRGGSYMGRKWYEDGKMFNKKNTFSDFVDCSKYLVEQGYTSPLHLYAMGGSAGGLLMGAVINTAPELYNGVIAAVPFVDVVTTMLDDDIPLTTSEYDEWGNPNNKNSYDYMLSYSPYDNVEALEYPNLLVTAGLYDSQVQYWEPAKWVAKLRAYKKGSNQLFLYTNMEAGHGGASGRFDSLKEIALEYSFLLDLENMKQ